MQEPEEQAPAPEPAPVEAPPKPEEPCEKDPDSDGADEDNDDESKGDNFEGFNGTGRTVTLQMLMAANVLHPGKSTMTIEYLGQKFVGDLLADGKIKSQETETIFLTPSAWAMHCKRIINPEKKSGCGWASVKYKGKKLDVYKATWLRKCAQQKDSTIEDDIDGDDKKPESPQPVVKRIVYQHNFISNRNIMHDANALVEAVPFSTVNKLQPFLLTISSTALFLADFHCHLTMNEVCGYFGGTWDVNSHTLAITKAYPCRNTRFDRQKAADVELEIQKCIMKDQLILVGWYHSHPKFQAEPTLRDCDSQLDYQIKMRGPSDATYTPCVSLIISPYFDENPTLESVSKSIWIVPPPENRQTMEYGRPMLMQYSVLTEKEFPEELCNEVRTCVDYYQKFRNEMVKFNGTFKEDIIYLEKLKNSLYPKFPRDVSPNVVWNTVRCALGYDDEEEFAMPAIATIEMMKEEVKTEPVQVKVESVKEESEAKNDKTAASELKVMSLQEQLCLPSGLNMNPTRLCSPLATPNPPAIPVPSTTPIPPLVPAPVSSTNSTTPTAASSPRDSPITIPSNSASPAKFEIPVRASPSPAKSDTSSNRTRNSPAPSPGKFSVSDISRNSPSITPNKYEPQPSPLASASATANDLMAASLASLAGQLPPNFLQTDIAALFRGHNSKDYGSSSLNQLAAAAAKVGGNKSNVDHSSSVSLDTNVYNSSGGFNIPGPSRPAMEQSSSSCSSTTSTKSMSKQERAESRSSKTSTSNSYKTKLMKELDDLKNDPLKMSELMRSPEYAALLLQQAEALGATTLGTLGFGADFSYLAGASGGSSKKQQNNALTADYNNLLQASKLLGYDSYMQQAKTSSDLNAFLQQQMAGVAAASTSSSSSSKKQQQQQQQQVQQQAPHPDYTTLLQTYSKLFDTSNQYGSSKPNSAHHELSALLAAGVGGMTGVGTGSSSSSSSSKKKQEAQQQQQQQNDMLNQLLQSEKNQSDLNALLYHQNKAAADLNALFAAPTSSGSSSSSKNAPTDPAAYYNQLAQEKMQDYAAYFQQNHGKYGIPDPLSKSTLAANNLFMSPSALLKLQQESLNAMMMKPPKSTSSSSSSSRARESSASPAQERLTPTKSGRDNSASGSQSGIKYNFSAVDLAISSVSSNTPSPAPSDGSGSSRRPSNTPPVDLSRLYSELAPPTKKRMEFSSIADLAAPPPKMPKINQDRDDILNLSSNE